VSAETEQDLVHDEPGDHARPKSPHQVMRTEVLPTIRAWRMALAASGVPVHESLAHCGPVCACGANDAGQFYRDPLCARHAAGESSWLKRKAPQ
jgi:hypothetical protein